MLRIGAANARMVCCKENDENVFMLCSHLFATNARMKGEWRLARMMLPRMHN